MNINLGKYTYLRNDDGTGQEALRNGEKWRDLVGDNFVMAMADKIQELEAENAEQEIECINAKNYMVTLSESFNRSIEENVELKTNITQLKRSRKQFGQESQWISVEDKNPDFCGAYYVHCDGCDDLVDYSCISEVWEESRLFGEVTHWMPRPNKPSAGE